MDPMNVVAVVERLVVVILNSIWDDTMVAAFVVVDVVDVVVLKLTGMIPMSWQSCEMVVVVVVVAVVVADPIAFPLSMDCSNMDVHFVDR